MLVVIVNSCSKKCKLYQGPTIQDGTKAMVRLTAIQTMKGQNQRQENEGIYTMLRCWRICSGSRSLLTKTLKESYKKNNNILSAITKSFQASKLQ